MAIFTPGPVIGQIRGSIGASTFSQSASAPTVRSKPFPSRSYKPAALTQRSRYSVATSAWRSLSAAARAAWDAYGQSITFLDSLGSSYHPSGFQAFIRQATIRADGELPDFAVPLAPGVAAFPEILFNLNDPSFELHFSSSSIGDDYSYALARLLYVQPGSINRPTYPVVYADTFQMSGVDEFNIFSFSIPDSYFPATAASGVVFSAWLSLRFRDVQNRWSSVSWLRCDKTY